MAIDPERFNHELGAAVSRVNRQRPRNRKCRICIAAFSN
ncbi:hypothetical protein ACVILL_004641 [Bradyrhizobium sp. USDA 3364]